MGSGMKRFIMLGLGVCATSFAAEEPVALEGMDETQAVSSEVAMHRSMQASKVAPKKKDCKKKKDGSCNRPCKKNQPKRKGAAKRALEQ
jgi:hypothetical protein